MAQNNVATEDAPDRLPGSVLRLLAPQRRRAVMRALMEDPNATHHVEDVVSAIRETQGTESVQEDPTFLRSSLHHTHLPKLDDADVVEYDPDDGTVQYQGDPTVERWIDQIDRIDEE